LDKILKFSLDIRVFFAFEGFFPVRFGVCLLRREVANVKIRSGGPRGGENFGLKVLFLSEVFEINFERILFRFVFASVAFFLGFEVNFSRQGLGIELRGVLVEKTGS
jgi:hypothetical protein